MIKSKLCTQPIPIRKLMGRDQNPLGLFETLFKLFDPFHTQAEYLILRKEKYNDYSKGKTMKDMKSKLETDGQSPSSSIDPLYVIFEQHLFNFQDPDLDRKTFVGNV